MKESPLLQVLKDAVAALESIGIRHALIGGLATIHFGNTRATRDVDMLVQCSDGTEPDLLDALNRSGFTIPRRRGSVIQAAHPTGYRLDLLLVDSPFEQAVLEHARATTDLGTRVTVARLEELVEENPAIDWSRLSQLLAMLGVSSEPDEWRLSVEGDDLHTLLRRLSRSIRKP